jgi:hypothetical protein
VPLTDERDFLAVADFRADGADDLLFEVLLEEAFLSEVFAFFAVVFEDDFFAFGTFAPAALASLKAIATACSRLRTLPPLPPLPDSNSPCLYSCMTSPILSCAFFEYFAITLVFCKSRELSRGLCCSYWLNGCRYYIRDDESG